MVFQYPRIYSQDFFHYICRKKMNLSLKENEGLPASLLWTLAIAAGISVANIYYNQPLLSMISHDLGISEFKANLIAMITQIGYAIGLLFIIPLGDMFQRKRIILVSFSILILSLLIIGLSQNIYIILSASFFTGMCSVMPQIFVPIASQFSKQEMKGRNVGIVISGLLTGILASRVISGLIGEYLGWRVMFFIAAILMLICSVVVIKVLPKITPTFKGKYIDLMKSLLLLIKEYPKLRIYSIRAALAFGSFLAMWSCLAFKMELPPFYAGSNVVGLLGLCGVAGALSASFVGKYVKQVGVKRFNYIGCALILFAWLLFYSGGNTYIGLIAGIIIIDIGMQCIQLSNQTSIFDLSPKAANRINTIFMTTYFIGGSLGTFLAGTFWHWFGWQGVIGVGICLTAISLLITIFSKN
ncbi:MAG: putative transporter [Parabacteroides sp.]